MIKIFEFVKDISNEEIIELIKVSFAFEKNNTFEEMKKLRGLTDEYTKIKKIIKNSETQNLLLKLKTQKGKLNIIQNRIETNLNSEEFPSLKDIIKKDVTIAFITIRNSSSIQKFIKTIIQVRLIF